MKKRFFRRLQLEDRFTQDSIPDQVSLLTVYMETIRKRVKSYTQNWNTHPIQLHPRRTNLVPGRPAMNFFLPKGDAKNLKCMLNQNLEQTELLKRLQEDTEEWDPNEYLPRSTLTWCHQQLIEIGQELVGIAFDPINPDPRFTGDTKSPFEAVYMKLRHRAYEHWISGQDPILDVCTKPIGAADWDPNKKHAVDRYGENVLEVFNEEC